MQQEQIFVLQKERKGQSSVEEEEDGECSAAKLIDKIVSLKAKLDQISNCHGDVKIKGIVSISLQLLISYLNLYTHIHYFLLKWKIPNIWK